MSLKFTEASSDRVTIAASASTQQLMPVSCLFWIYCTSYHSSNVHILTKGPTTTFAREITLRTTGQIDCFFRTSGTSPTARSANSAGNRLPIGSWTLLAITVDASLVPHIYFGSESVAAAEVSYQTQTTGTGTVYNDTGLDGHFGNYEAAYAYAPDMTLAYAAIFSTALTLADIQDWQFNPRAMTGAVGFWAFGGTGTQTDLSGNGNDGTLTGTTDSTSWPVIRKITASPGSYALTGTAATLRADRTLAAGTGSYAWTGQDAGLYRDYTLAAAAGSYALTGQAAALLATRSLTASAGSYAWTGADAALRKGFTLTAGAGSYAWTGQDASLLAARLLTAGAGSYAVTGQSARLTVARKLTAGAGAYSWTGQSASLIYSGAGSSTYTLTAEAGNYTLTGQAAGLLVDRTLVAGAGTYTVTGQDAALIAARLLTAGSGSYALTGQDAALLVGRVLAAAGGTYTWTGQDAGLRASRVLQAAAGTYTWTGLSVSLIYSAATGVFGVIQGSPRYHGAPTGTSRYTGTAQWAPRYHGDGQ